MLTPPRQNTLTVAVTSSQAMMLASVVTARVSPRTVVVAPQMAEAEMAVVAPQMAEAEMAVVAPQMAEAEAVVANSHHPIALVRLPSTRPAHLIQRCGGAGLAGRRVGGPSAPGHPSRWVHSDRPHSHIGGTGRCTSDLLRQVLELPLPSVRVFIVRWARAIVTRPGASPDADVHSPITTCRRSTVAPARVMIRE